MRLKIMGAHVVFHRMLTTSGKRSICAILFSKRTLDAPMHPGCWGLFGGALDKGEQPMQAAIREVQEELGIQSNKLTLKALCDVRIRRNNENGALGLRYFSSELELDMDRLTLRRNGKEHKVEGEGLGWFTAEEIHHMFVRPEDRIAVDMFFHRHGV